MSSSPFEDTWKDRWVECPHCGFGAKYHVFYDWESIGDEVNEVYYDITRQGQPTEFRCPKCFDLIIYDVHLTGQPSTFSRELLLLVALVAFIVAVYLIFF